MRQELVIFDCDGVLVDSEPISNRVFTDVLLGFQNQLSFGAFYHEGVEDFRECNSLGESNVNDWTDDLGDGSLSGHELSYACKSGTKIVRPPRNSAPNFALCECITTHLNFSAPQTVLNPPS